MILGSLIADDNRWIPQHKHARTHPLRNERHSSCDKKNECNLWITSYIYLICWQTEQRSEMHNLIKFFGKITWSTNLQINKNIWQLSTRLNSGWINNDGINYGCIHIIRLVKCLSLAQYPLSAVAAAHNPSTYVAPANNECRKEMR